MAVITPSNLVFSSGIAAVAYGLWKFIYVAIVQPYSSSIRYIPGPPNTSFFFGHLRDIFKADSAVLQEQWTEEYGSTFKYKGFFNSDRFYTIDTRALNHILTHSADYQKPEEARFGLAQTLGHGLLVAEDESHRKQRRIMNPAFGPTQIRELTEIFVDKALQLRDVWSAEIGASGESARVNVLKGLTKMTLDVIGLAGFNYEFDALNAHGKPNELNTAFNTMFNVMAGSNRFLQVIQSRSRIFRAIPSQQTRRARAAQRVMRRIGMGLVAEKKAAIRKELSGEGKDDTGRGLHGRDLLSLLLKANMAADEHQRLSDDDVLAQVPTFIVAGHETTSVATTWCLFALTQALDVQRKLREELLTLDTDTPTMDELNALPYLDMVVKETMRVHAPVPNTIRVAARDDVVPLGTPIVDTRGEVIHSIKFDKGQVIFIPILAMNRSKSLWGEDALEFRPERWENVPDSVVGIPGVWSHLMSFLGGPRACIGYRFSIVEMKALVFTLVRAFEFELAVSPEDIIKRSIVVERPLVKSEKEKGAQMPLLIKPYQRS